MGLLLAALLVWACGKDEIIPGRRGTPESGAQEQVPTIAPVARLIVNTEKGVAVDSKDPADYRRCTVTVEGGGTESPLLDVPGQIRGRGNSTWEWYPKKPYRIKLDNSSSLLGLPANRDWVLLANYRDVTHMMNAVGFYLASELGLPYTNHIRFVTLTLNGKDMGLYTLTEQVEEGGNRVRLDKDNGILLALDVDDGPRYQPTATDNFWSQVFSMACAVKYPADATRADATKVREAFGKLEKAIEDEDWEEIQELLDVESMIHYILVQEIIQNVEMDNNPSIRSGFIHRYDSRSKWVMGPLWDCDAGFDYNWGDMYDYYGLGHTFFENYRELVFGADPYYGGSVYGSGTSPFFSCMFGNEEFVKQLQECWKLNHESLLTGVLDYIDEMEILIADYAARDGALWNISRYNHAEEVNKMKQWLQNRFNYLDGIINNYPVGTSSSPEGPSAKAEIKATISFDTTYQQDGHYHGPYIELSDVQKKTIEDALGVKYGDLIYLYYDDALGFWAVEPDGSFNPQNTANAPGHWFNAAGYVTPHGQDSYIFSEYIFDDGTYQDTFSLGKHPAITTPGKYTVSQAFVYREKAVKFVFNITIT